MEAVRERGVGFACSYNSLTSPHPHLTSSQAMPMSYRVFNLPLVSHVALQADSRTFKLEFLQDQKGNSQPQFLSAQS